MKKGFRLSSFVFALILVFSSFPVFNLSAIDGNVEPYIDSSEMFEDVEAGAWYIQYIDYVVGHGFFSGTGDGRFAPSLTMTRAMIAMTIYNIEGKPEISEPSPFVDCPDGKWYSDAVTWAAYYGIVKGVGGGYYEPDRTVTRQEAVCIMERYVKEYKSMNVYLTDDLSSFSDIPDISSWAKSSVEWSVGAKLINGINEGEDTFIRPLKGMSRAEFAVILTKYDKIIANKVLSVYYDANNIGSLTGMFENDVKNTDIINYIGLNIESYNMYSDTLYYNWAHKSFKEDKAGQNYIRTQNPDAKIILTVAGQYGTGKYNTSFLELTTTEEKCIMACRALVKVMADSGFDGLDIDWEFPDGSDYQRNATGLFIRTLRSELNARGKADGRKYYLTAAVPNTIWPFYLFDMESFYNSCDYINLMSYDSHMYDNYVLHHTAPREDSTGLYTDSGFSAEGTIRIFNENGIPSDKILIGCGLYGVCWDGVPENGRHGLGAIATPVGQSYHYKDLNYLVNSGSFKMYWDMTAKAAFLYNGNRFVSIDIDDSIANKNLVAEEQGCGGLMLFCYSTYRGNSLTTSVSNWLDWNFHYPVAQTWTFSGYIQ